jgi:hypothetical protein
MKRPDESDGQDFQWQLPPIMKKSEEESTLYINSGFPSSAMS